MVLSVRGTSTHLSPLFLSLSSLSLSHTRALTRLLVANRNISKDESPLHTSLFTAHRKTFKLHCVWSATGWHPIHQSPVMSERYPPLLFFLHTNHFFLAELSFLPVNLHLLLRWLLSLKYNSSFVMNVPEVTQEQTHASPTTYSLTDERLPSVANANRIKVSTG